MNQWNIFFRFNTTTTFDAEDVFYTKFANYNTINNLEKKLPKEFKHLFVYTNEKWKRRVVFNASCNFKISHITNTKSSFIVRVTKKSKIRFTL